MKNPFATFTSLLLVACFGVIAATEVSRCYNQEVPLPDVVAIENCDKSPCTFYINYESRMSINFRAPRYLEHIAPRAQAVVMGLNLSYPLGQDDACDGVTNTPCPLAKGEYIEYSYGMLVLDIFPEVGLNLEFSLLDNDQGGQAFVCFNVDLQLVKKN
ncbi:hypothetical protein MTP99_011038 [Tenebrio molitor]|jgi:Niemann-Pick C2 protein|nr:hypothetical protein MTP99_011038 [Tenebrio molitor]